MIKSLLSKGFIVALFGGFSIPANAQYDPQKYISIASPTAASLGKYADIPVSYHTGAPQISIPLYTVQEGTLRLPISLSYHATGLKTMEPASWVGAGWSLNAGGVITRSVRGMADEKGTAGSSHTAGHFSDYGFNNYFSGCSNNECWNDFAESRKDGEPDLFFFNFGSYTGKFYFNDDRTPMLVPEADFKIEPYFTGSGSIQRFTITVPDGTKYYFGRTASTTDTDPVEITNSVNSGNGSTFSTVISSWYLNKITSADNQFSISMSYQPENYGYFNLAMFPLKSIPDQNIPYEYDLIKNVIQGVRLSQVQFTGGSVSFVPVSGRSDLSDAANVLVDNDNQQAVALGAIQITGTGLCKKYQLAYDYFIDNTTPLPGYLAFAQYNLHTDKKRLRLNSVQEMTCDEATTLPPHQFTYFTETVPRRLTFGIDHWGYANGVDTNKMLIPSLKINDGQTVTVTEGGNREAAWPAMRGGMLQKITYPTGGSSEMEFESNTASLTYEVDVSYGQYWTVHQNGQNTQNSQTQTLNLTGSNPCSVNITNTASYQVFFVITTMNDAIVQGPWHCLEATNAGSGTAMLSITLPPGQYKGKLYYQEPASNLNGGAGAVLQQWQTNPITGNVTVGGIRIKKLTNYDPVSNQSITTDYSYLSGSVSSATFYSRPVYVGMVRNDQIRDVGLWHPSTGYQPAIYLNGCTTGYFKSPSSIRPMETTQGGGPVGYNKVRVTQQGNGYSEYEYYGTPAWQTNMGNIAITKVNTVGCDGSTPNYPAAPLPDDYKRGELKHEAHYSEAGTLLSETDYLCTYVPNPLTTPGFIAVVHTGATVMTYLGTKYTMSTARKTQATRIDRVYAAGAGATNTITTTDYGSAFHNQPTTITTQTSTGITTEKKVKYAFDYAVAACTGLTDGLGQYNSDCAACLTSYQSQAAACANSSDPYCPTAARVQWSACRITARQNFVSYRRQTFTDATNTYAANHLTAKNAATAELRPILQLQDSYTNNPVEETTFKDSKLTAAYLSRFGYMDTVTTTAYPYKMQAINIAAPSVSFTTSAVSSNMLIKDDRYQPEGELEWDKGNLVAVQKKEGITTVYLYGYTNTRPVAKVACSGCTYGLVKTLVNPAVLQSPASDAALRTELNNLRTGLPAAMVTTYTYSTTNGMTSETAPDGRTLYYEYDVLGRLRDVKDHNGNVVKTYDYQYQQTP